MEIEGDIRSIHLIAFVVGAIKLLFDFCSQSPIFLSVFHFEHVEVLLLQSLNDPPVT